MAPSHNQHAISTAVQYCWPCHKRASQLSSARKCQNAHLSQVQLVSYRLLSFCSSSSPFLSDVAKIREMRHQWPKTTKWRQFATSPYGPCWPWDQKHSPETEYIYSTSTVKLTHFTVEFCLTALRFQTLNEHFQERIQYKLCVLVFKCKHSLAPACLSEQLQQVAQLESRQRLRSSSSSAFVMPATRRSTLGDRSFSTADTRAWNSLPHTVTAASTLSLFRRHLKSHLFTKSFPSWRWLLLADSTCCDCVKCPCTFQLYITLYQFFLHYIPLLTEYLLVMSVYSTPSDSCLMAINALFVGWLFQHQVIINSITKSSYFYPLCT